MRSTLAQRCIEVWEQGMVRLIAFQNDEEGMEVMQGLLLLFVALVILFGAWLLFNGQAWPSIKNSVTNVISVSAPK